MIDLNPSPYVLWERIAANRFPSDTKFDILMAVAQRWYNTAGRYADILGDFGYSKEKFDADSYQELGAWISADNRAPFAMVPLLLTTLADLKEKAKLYHKNLEDLRRSLETFLRLAEAARSAPTNGTARYRLTSWTEEQFLDVLKRFRGLGIDLDETE